MTDELDMLYEDNGPATTPPPGGGAGPDPDDDDRGLPVGVSAAVAVLLLVAGGVAGWFLTEGSPAEATDGQLDQEGRLQLDLDPYLKTDPKLLIYDPVMTFETGFKGTPRVAIWRSGWPTVEACPRRARFEGNRFG